MIMQSRYLSGSFSDVRQKVEDINNILSELNRKLVKTQLDYFA